MSPNSFILVPLLAAKPAPPAPAKGESPLGLLGVLGMAIMAAALAGTVAYSKLQFAKKDKQLKIERYKIQDLEKKLKLALNTIKKMEANPDLVHSRDFNLDYLRMRMEEEVFHYSIVNQVKVRIKQVISVALRPSTSDTATVGVATSGRQVDEIFDIHYETEVQGKRMKGVLFRIHIQLMKLPTQSTSTTIEQLIDCVETFLSPKEDHDTWQPVIQGRVVAMDWDQKAKPTPLLVLRQSDEGVNVSFRTNPIRKEHGEPSPAVAPRPTPKGSGPGKPPRPPQAKA